jgi:hypothetical protein
MTVASQIGVGIDAIAITTSQLVMETKRRKENNFGHDEDKQLCNLMLHIL